MVLKVDAKKCIGCGLCVSMCPDVFELKDDGKSYVKDASGCAKGKCDCASVAESCPVKAITYKK